MQAVVLVQFGAASHLAVHTVPDPRPGPAKVAGRLVLSPDAPAREVA